MIPHLARSSTIAVCSANGSRVGQPMAAMRRGSGGRHRRTLGAEDKRPPSASDRCRYGTALRWQRSNEPVRSGTVGRDGELKDGLEVLGVALCQRNTTLQDQGCSPRLTRSHHPFTLPGRCRPILACIWSRILHAGASLAPPRWLDRLQTARAAMRVHKGSCRAGWLRMSKPRHSIFFGRSAGTIAGCPARGPE
jgi:hypothetical protein